MPALIASSGKLPVALETLNVDDVRRIHYALVDEFELSPNPIYPPGVKSENLLASAVSRQATSLRGILKYPDPYSNAASLTFGLCCDHPFHNGNKRTALVSLLVHLYRNKLVFENVGEKELYDLVIKISTHAIANGKKKSKHYPDRPGSDDEVSALSDWIKDNSRFIQKGERQITYRQLRRILEHFSYILENPKGNSINIIRLDKTSNIFLRTIEVPFRIGSIPYPGDKVIVGVKDLKYVRALCKLTAEDGIDSEAFYAEGDPADAFIIKYRAILERLANK